MTLNDAKLWACSGPVNDAQEAAVFHLCQAAMWQALGRQVKLSRSGFSLTFAPSYRHGGRADLSGILPIAMQQLATAEIDVSAVTDEVWDAYHVWREQMDNAKKYGEARFLITRKFSEPYVGSCGSCGIFNRVSLIDGFGQYVASERVECKSYWDANVKNLIGTMGASCARPDYATITSVISSMRAAYPEYADVIIIDKNKE